MRPEEPPDSDNVPALEGVDARWYRLATGQPSGPIAYLWALLALLASLGATLAIDHLEPTTEFHAINVLAVLVVAVLWGRGPALLTAIGGTLAIDFLFGAPRGVVLDSVHGVVRVLVYGTVSLVAAEVAAALRSTLHAVDTYRLASERTNRIRRNVLAVVTHDLRSPLSGIGLHATVIERSVDDPAATERIRAAAGTIRAGVEQMRHIVSDLNDAVRIELGSFPITPRSRAPGDVARAAADLMRPIAEQAGVTLALDVEASLPTVSCDRIEQALGNLLGNAVKFTGRGGAVTLRVRRDGQRVRFDVVDTGPGIPASDLPRLFDRYWKGDSGRAHGTGLGLFITQGLVRSNGGTVSASSRVGEGSTFTIELPIERAAGA